MAIQAAFIFNNHGKPRLTRFYTQPPIARQQALIQRTFSLVHKRTSLDNGRELCNFLDAPELRTLLPAARLQTGAGGAPSARKAAKARRVEGGAELAAYDEDVDTRPRESQAASSVRSGKRVAAPLEAHEDQLRVIYRHYATLYFVFIVDESESELGILDLIQVFVEALDRVFENVCELDLIFHFDEVHMVLNEIVQGGLVVETNLAEIVQSARAVAQARRASANASNPLASVTSSASSGQISPFGIVNSAGLGGMPWAGAAGWARDLGARLTSGSGGGTVGFGRASRQM